MNELDANKLYEEYEYLIDYWINKKYGNNLAADLKDDLYLEGAKGLYQAAQNYDPGTESQAKFAMSLSLNRKSRAREQARRKVTGGLYRSRTLCACGLTRSTR